MVQKLSITLALEGGKQIEKQLDAIGEAGKEAFGEIGKAAEQVGGFKELKPEEVTAKLKALGVTGVEAINKIQAAVKQAGRLEGLVQGVASVEAAFTALAANAVPIIGVIAAGLYKAAKLALEWADAVNKVSTEAIKLGSTVEQVSKLRAALGKAGISSEAISDGLQKINAAVEKGKIDQVAKDLERLQEISKRGYGGQGTVELNRLIETAQGFGPAAAAADKALKDLGVTLRGGAQSLTELQQKLGETQGIVAFIQQLEGMKNTVDRNALAVRDLGAKMGAELAQAIDTGSISAEKFAQNMMAAAQVTQQQAIEAAKTQQTLNQLSAEWDNFKAAVVAPVAVPLLSFLRSELEGIQAGIKNTVMEFTKLGEIITAVFSNPLGNTYNELIKIGGAVVALTAKIAEAVRWLGRLGGGGGQPGSTTPIPGNAAGGLIGGRGSGTSDSNLAWLSRGEHIMPARAVSQPGVLAFLEALRRSGGNLSRVLDRMGHFAMGGPVGMPAFAAGGSVGSMSHVTIAFPGLPEIGGLRASSAVVEELQRAAAMAQVRSGGRKPSRYR